MPDFHRWGVSKPLIMIVYREDNPGMGRLAFIFMDDLKHPGYRVGDIRCQKALGTL
jgi:hypothetical protein